MELPILRFLGINMSPNTIGKYKVHRLVQHIRTTLWNVRDASTTMVTIELHT
jgi:hypothetical protein